MAVFEHMTVRVYETLLISSETKYNAYELTGVNVCPAVRYRISSPPAARTASRDPSTAPIVRLSPHLLRILSLSIS